MHWIATDRAQRSGHLLLVAVHRSGEPEQPAASDRQQCKGSVLAAKAVNTQVHCNRPEPSRVDQHVPIATATERSVSTRPRRTHLPRRTAIDMDRADCDSCGAHKHTRNGCETHRNGWRACRHWDASNAARMMTENNVLHQQRVGARVGAAHLPELPAPQPRAGGGGHVHCDRPDDTTAKAVP